MKVLIVGYGSIGKRHYEILKGLTGISSIDLVSKHAQAIEGSNIYQGLNDINDLECYDYFIIASETSKHYQQLKYLCSQVNDKIILVEKPLYEKKYPEIECNNKVFTAYNLRFHPVLQKIRELIKNENVLYANAICGQYLPSWRPEQDYRESYSADIAKGGGVLRDLSHELDYLSWLFGSFSSVSSISSKISDLEINSDDIFTAIAITDMKVVVNVTVDYISKLPIRRLIIHTKKYTIEADIIKGFIIVHTKDEKEITYDIPNKHRNYTYTKMHQAIINNNFDAMCSLKEGNEIMGIINDVVFKEL